VVLKSVRQYNDKSSEKTIFAPRTYIVNPPSSSASSILFIDLTDQRSTTTTYNNIISTISVPLLFVTCYTYTVYLHIMIRVYYLFTCTYTCTPYYIILLYTAWLRYKRVIFCLHTIRVTNNGLL